MFVLLSQMSYQVTKICLFFPLALCLFLTGCGGKNPEAQFVSSKKRESLIKQAQTGKFEMDGQKVDLMGVDDYMKELFGSPAEMVVWQRLPVDYGGIQGEVIESNGEGQLTVQFNESVDAFSTPQPAYWMTGEDDNQEFTVTSYDPVTKKIVVQGDFENRPKKGTSFILNPGKRLKQGYRLYMEHCLHCHGTSGDGAGPTAKYLTPRPRDFRKGIFKFKSTPFKNKIRRDDLSRTLQNGIPGTYMPSFKLLKDDESKAIIEYVRWLSMRGTIEDQMSAKLTTDYSKKSLAKEIKSKKGSDEKQEAKKEIIQDLLKELRTRFPKKANKISKQVSSSWKIVENDLTLIVLPKVAQPVYKRNSQEYRNSLQRGSKLFQTTCLICHGPKGRGDGENAERYHKNESVSPPRDYDQIGFHDSWGNPIKPRDLTQGIYRGGRRPLDIYRRIRGGIPGTPMPGADKLSDEQIWDTVNFIMSLPYKNK